MRAPRLYALLLYAYPRRFRRRYAAAMSEAFRAGYARARLEDNPRRFLARAILDVLVNASLEWRDAIRDWIFNPPQEAKSMFWQSTWADIRHALRLFARAPGFTGLAVTAFALGIGANSAIFTIVNAVLLTPLPYADPDRLVMIWAANPAQGAPLAAMSEGDAIDIRRATTTLRQVEIFQANVVPVQLTVDANTMSAGAVAVTAEMFSLLGRSALLGRTVQTGDRFTIVLAYGYWQRQFGGDPGVVGRSVAVGGRPATIVGVMPADFGFPYRSMLLSPISFARAANADLWLPMTPNPARSINDAQRIFGIVARMKPDIEVEQVRAEVAATAREIARLHPHTNAGWTATAVPVHEQAVGATRSTLLLLLTGVAVVLLMACVNVANLLLARSVQRQREMAVRTALGAGRGRLVRQALTESLLLSIVGACVAWLVVTWSMRAFVAMAPADIPRLPEIAPDWRVAAYIAALALVTGVATGVLPAVTASRLTLQRVLTEVARGTVSTRGRRARSILVAAEVALALVLSVGAGLLARSFIEVLKVDPGFRTENVLTMQVNLVGSSKTADQRREFYRQLFARLEAIPGVIGVGGTTRLPLGGASSSTQVTIEGRELSRGGLADVGLRRAMHDYFSVMGISVVRGRAFDHRDGPNAPSVVIINETMARRVFPGEDPLGRRVRLAENAGIGAATIVGVVSDVRHDGLEAVPQPEIYIHYLQNPPTAPLIVLRTAGEPSLMSSDARRAAREIDPALRIFDLRTMADLRTEAVSQRRFLTLLALLFGGLALALAVVGVFGVMTLVVAERTPEMGIRLALGAAPSRVLGLVLLDGVRLTGTGLLIGVAVSIALTPLMASQLYGVAAVDPLTLVGVPALLLGIALLACVIPARRAMRVDPVTALRYE
jgi:predicted permease